MTDWSQLRDAYGPADHVPGLLAQVEPDVRSEIWTALWSRLCHQGTVYSASFAALPALTGIAGRWSAADRVMPLVLAGHIVASVDQPYGDIDAIASYPSEIARLTALTEETLPSVDDSTNYVHVLQALLAFEGVEVWGEQLDGLNDEEYEVACPHCDEEVSIPLWRYGTPAKMYELGTDSMCRSLAPADPAALTGVGQRLHARAVADGHPDVAEKLTYVFGSADCPLCGKRFAVEEAIVAKWGD